MEFSVLEQKYIEDALMIGKEKGDSHELSQLCSKAYDDYQKGVISEKAYGRVYGICCEFAYPR